MKGRAKDFLQLRPRFVAAEGEVGRFAAVEADDVGEEADLRGLSRSMARMASLPARPMSVPSGRFSRCA